MTHTLVIAECGSSWRFGSDPLSNAYKLIDAVKECGADVAKFQWTSNGNRVANRRNLGMDAAQMYSKYLEWPREWMEKLKAHCDKVGLEWMCTVYVPEDIPVIAPLVKRFKVSAFESQDAQFIAAHLKGRALRGPWNDHEVIISLNPGNMVPMHLDAAPRVKTLHCISLYPTELENLKLRYSAHDGLSDHTTSTLTGAVAVGCGATIIEKHVRLRDTPQDNPDFTHSLEADRPLSPDCYDCGYVWRPFKEYVDNIREAERML